MPGSFERKKTGETKPSPFTERRKAAREAVELWEFAQKDLEELEWATEKIIKKLRPDIEKGEYSLIIGDDASGRVPTFIIGHILKSIYDQKGFPLPLVRWIAGSSFSSRDPSQWSKDKQGLVTEHIGKIKHTLSKTPHKGEKVLIVTDTIALGRSVKVLLEGLAAHGMKADVATIGLMGASPDSDPVEDIERKLNARVVPGMYRMPRIYRSTISGVTKSKRDLFAAPDPEISVGDVRAARAVAQEIADRIATEYLEGKL